MKSYFAYIRVSTVKQEEHGSSLHEQRDAITSFAARQNLHISDWFEERETAAKVGRREFTRMVAALKKGKASGVIFHKIDRSARNLKDWSAVQDLADLGIDVRFTQESINLGSNEGKLTGDFLAVIASHYIRNLREEVRKGIRGRLKQGLFPFRAYTGYLDQGGGKPKVPDPRIAPLVRSAFELYSSGTYSLHALSEELYKRGLRNTSGKRVGVNRLSDMLRNPFYVGVIRMKRTGESYLGVHEPLISKRVFDRVQDVLDGKRVKGTTTNDFLFRRVVKCAYCEYSLVGERQKGHIYYRCHSRECPTVSHREEAIEAAIRGQLVALDFTEAEAADLRDRARILAAENASTRADREQGVALQIEVVSGRLARLMDLYLSDEVERALFAEKRLALLMERKDLEEERERIASASDTVAETLHKYLEPLNSPLLSYETANPAEKRKLIATVTSNLQASEKNVVVELKSPFREVANLTTVQTGGPLRGGPRTLSRRAFELIVEHCRTHVTESDEGSLSVAA
jgi:site-specific DNA recombinase